MTDGVWITKLADGTRGRRLAVKDLFDTAGIRTTYGSAVFGDHVPAQTAPVVAALETRGYVNVGKTNLHEFAYGVTSQNLHYGVVPNPRHPALTAGGSSGGSAAALVLDEADVALGTDTGGSIRIPAACCDLAGFKPTYGLWPTDGIFPLAPSFDHAGPMARDVAGCIELLDLDVPEVSLDDLAIARAWSDDATIDFPTAEPVVRAFMREVADVHRELYLEHAELYGENIRGKIERCLAVDDGEYDAAVRARAELRERAEEALAGFDLLVTPVLSCPVPPVDAVEVEVRAAMTLYTFPFNALGWPALALGNTQIAGRAGADALVLGAGLAFEALKA
ncbi:MAG TPA: amidase [Gaiellaceae bacterium]|nr:amidase [Gaiellaceae bacterium]